MGAYFETHTIRAANKDQAVAAAKEFQRSQQHEHGHSPYGGHLGTAGIGVQLMWKQFDSAQGAADWVVDAHNKNELPYLVKYGTGDEWLLVGWCRS